MGLYETRERFRVETARLSQRVAGNAGNTLCIEGIGYEREVSPTRRGGVYRRMCRTHVTC